MASHSQRGQVLIELVLYTLLLVGLFMIAFTLSETVMKQEGKARFTNAHTGRNRSGGLK